MQAGLDREQERLAQAGMQVETILIAGNPAATLNAHAEEIQADLMLIGAKGLRATLGILLGGVAQQVVEYSTCPVLVVRAPYHGLTRILLVTDGSEQSKHTLVLPGAALPGWLAAALLMAAAGREDQRHARIAAAHPGGGRRHPPGL